jgi:hypothetical protein
LQFEAKGGLRFEPLVSATTQKYMVFMVTITQDKVGDADLGIALAGKKGEGWCVLAIYR